MAYMEMSLNERINFKSWRMGAGVKLFKRDLQCRGDEFEFWKFAKRLAQEPCRRPY